METSEFHEHITHDCVWHTTLNVENSGGYVAKYVCCKKLAYVGKGMIMSEKLWFYNYTFQPNQHDITIKIYA